LSQWMSFCPVTPVAACSLDALCVIEEHSTLR